LRPWLTIDETATYLTDSRGALVHPADLLRKGLQWELKLSAYFVNPFYVMDEGVYVDVSSGGEPPGTVPRQFVTSHFYGTFDLTMFGRERITVEKLYQSLVGGTSRERHDDNGVEVTLDGPEESFLVLMVPSREAKDMFHPARLLPADAMLVVTKENLQAFEKSLTVPSVVASGHATPSKKGDTRELTSLLHILGAVLDLVQTLGPDGKPRSGFKGQTAIKDALEAYEAYGLSRRNLDTYFALANRTLEANSRL
jgi:hypothetical protein